MQPDSSDLSIMDPVHAMILVLLANLCVVGAAIIVSLYIKRRKRMPHLLAFLWLIASFFLLGYLGLPPDDDGNNPGYGIMFLPVMAEIGIYVAAYLAFELGYLLLKFLRHVIGASHRAETG